MLVRLKIIHDGFDSRRHLEWIMLLLLRLSIGVPSRLMTSNSKWRDHPSCASTANRDVGCESMRVTRVVQKSGTNDVRSLQTQQTDAMLYGNRRSESCLRKMFLPLSRMNLKMTNKSSDGREVMDVLTVIPMLGDRTLRYRRVEEFENVSENRATAQSGSMRSGFVIF